MTNPTETFSLPNIQWVLNHFDGIFWSTNPINIATNGRSPDLNFVEEQIWSALLDWNQTANLHTIRNGYSSLLHNGLIIVSLITTISIELFFFRFIRIEEDCLIRAVLTKMPNILFSSLVVSFHVLFSQRLC